MLDNKILESIQNCKEHTNLSKASKLAPEGLVMEFGVHRGGTIKEIAGSLPSRKVYGFDSFEGLPESWNNLGAGHFACDIPQDLPKNVELVIGLFEDTLPKFLKSHGDSVAFVHIDCDLYSSTKTIFNWLKNRFVTGSIVCFDEIINYGGEDWRNHEYKAFTEFLDETKYQYECIGKWGAHQAAFKITV